MPAERRRGRAGVLVVLAGTLVFTAAWAALHPRIPVQPDADLFGHLSVSRHLLRGEGFRTDVTYPLSFAYPFARELPQPLLTSGPGLPVLFAAPARTADLEPARTLVHVRRLQIALLALVFLGGAAVLWRRGRAAGALPWGLLLLLHPLLPFAVDWGFGELACGGLLLVLWLRRAGGPAPVRAGALDGLAWGALVLIRADLAWVPLLWAAGRVGGDADARRMRLRRLGLAALVAAALLTPWLVRNARVTGDPFFALQTRAELVKDTRILPGYEVYRGLDPWPLRRVLAEAPGPLARKAARGARFFGGGMVRFVPPLVLLGLVALAVTDRRRSGPERPGAPGLAVATLLLLAAQYAFFDHSLRHLLPVLPILAWEAACAGGRDLRTALLVALAVAIAPRHLAGWEAARRTAVASATPAARAALDIPPVDGVYFFPHAAGPWFLDRPGVWRSPAALRDVPRLLDRSAPPDDRPKERP